MGVLFGRTVEGRRRNFTTNAATHVGDFFGTLVNEQHDEVHVGIVRLDGLCDLLHHRGLTGLRRRHDEATLAFADGGDEVHDARCQVELRCVEGFESQLLVRKQGGQVFEARTVTGKFGVKALNGVNAIQRGVLLI